MITKAKIKKRDVRSSLTKKFGFDVLADTKESFTSISTAGLANRRKTGADGPYNVISKSIPSEALIYTEIIDLPSTDGRSTNSKTFRVYFYAEELIKRGFDVIQMGVLTAGVYSGSKVVESLLELEGSPSVDQLNEFERRTVDYVKSEGSTETVLTWHLREYIDDHISESLASGEEVPSENGTYRIPTFATRSTDPGVSYIPGPDYGPFPSRRLSVSETSRIYKELAEDVAERLSKITMGDYTDGTAAEDLSYSTSRGDYASAADSLFHMDKVEAAFYRRLMPAIMPLYSRRIETGAKPHRRPPPGFAIGEIIEGALPGILAELRERLGAAALEVSPPPPITEIIEIRGPMIAVDSKTLEMPGAGQSLFISARGFSEDGRPKPIGKHLVKNNIRLIAGGIVEFFKGAESNAIPKIEGAPRGGVKNQLDLNVSIPMGSMVNKLEIYRREISTRPYNDNYDLIQSFTLDSSSSARPKSIFFTDFVNLEERTYRYIAVPSVLNERLPVFSEFQIGESSSKPSVEPGAYAIQKEKKVRIYITGIPEEAAEIIIYRRSSLTGKYELIRTQNVIESFDAETGVGKALKSVEIDDELSTTSVMDQEITYKLMFDDKKGRIFPFETKPSVHFKLPKTTDKGQPTDVKVSEEDGQIYVTVQFEAQNLVNGTELGVDGLSSLTSPPPTLVQAANDGLNIARLIITRFDTRTGERELIARPIVNLGLTELEVESVVSSSGVPTYKTVFIDNARAAFKGGYSPVVPQATYRYLVDIAIYPLSLEMTYLRSIRGVTVTPEDTTRTEYTYDPFIFDHPAKIENGIIPGASSAKTMFQLFEIAQTGVTKNAKIQVSNSTRELEMPMNAKIREDYQEDQCVQLSFSVPLQIVDELDHIEVLATTNEIEGYHVIDELFATDAGTLNYYDYQMIHAIGDTISYKLRLIGKTMVPIFESQEASVSYTKLSYSGDHRVAALLSTISG